MYTMNIPSDTSYKIQVSFLGYVQAVKPEKDKDGNEVYFSGSSVCNIGLIIDVDTSE